MGAVKKIVDAIMPKVVIKKVEVKEVEVKCDNCTGNGEQCVSCSVPFTDTFGQ